MYIEKYKKIACGIILSLGLLSCEKEIDVDLNDSEPRLVIEATITPDSVAKVRLTKSKNFHEDNTFAPVEGAVVTISDDANNEETLNFDSSLEIYKSLSLKGVMGRTYTLKVLVDGEEYTSTSRMPAHVVPIDSVLMYEIPALEYRMPQVWFKDPNGSKNYYRTVLHINDVRKNFGEDITTTDNKEGFVIARILPIFSEDGEEDIDPIFVGDRLTIEHHCIDKDVYTYFETLKGYTMTQANPASNINGGALGYFSAYTFDRKEIIANW